MDLDAAELALEQAEPQHDRELKHDQRADRDSSRDHQPGPGIDAGRVAPGAGSGLQPGDH